ncbi:hypothetical protein [Dyadobacter bucti]|uniref:hypothetical protein n=1 Tax=Dyadobacter bucti TaxID=2572203 RepID=UPI003F70502E
MNLAKDEKMAYDQSLKAQWDYLNSMDYVEKKGFERGVEKEKLNNARAMKIKGIDNRIISEVTGLSAEQVEAL